jgi:hypothetical protein
MIESSVIPFFWLARTVILGLLFFSHAEDSRLSESSYMVDTRSHGTTLSKCAMMAALACISSIACGDEIPPLDSVHYCETVASLFSNNNASKSACMELESKRKGQVERIWGEIPAEFQKQCVALAKFSNGESYQGLAECIGRYVAGAYLEGELKLSK